MKKKIDKILKSFLLSFFVLICPIAVKAASATVEFSANSSVNVGDQISVSMFVSNINGANGGIVSVGGNLSFDSSHLQYISASGVSSPYLFQINPSANYKLAGLDTSLANGINSRTRVFTFTFKALKAGSTTVSLSNAVLTDIAQKVQTSVVGKTINITPPPSPNNNLKSLSVSNGNINFNKDTTTYNINVESGVTNINVNAEAEDTGARVNGVGNRALNYGNNSIVITVTAPSGAVKNYTINVNRKDDRSSNNNLASLSVNGGSLSPGFNANTTNYSVSVPFNISTLQVNATPQDAKSKVSVSDTALVAEETRAIHVTVTAENGAQKTYVINAHRGKDPNKVLSTNNFLSKLNVSNGVLSPAFNKEHENYIVYLPYEVDRIEFDLDVEDKRYATIKREGPDVLAVGNNNYKFIVTAEDNSTKTYTVTVSRGINMTGEALSSNIYLKEIKIKNGSLKGTFDKKTFSYKYTGGKIEAIPEDENSIVDIIENDNSAIIMVKSPSGEVGIYTLILSKINILNIIIYIALIFAIIGAFFGGYYFKKNNIIDIEKIFTKKEKKTNKKESKKKAE